MDKPKIQTVEFYNVTDLVPEEWGSWFWGLVSGDAPFSWGDNNRTLVTASRFYDHCNEKLEFVVEDGDVTQDEVDAFLKTIEDLGETYIDLEN